jgi:glutamate/tyrosine decarboxylase-like PLP-dependent enzyme
MSRIYQPSLGQTALFPVSEERKRVDDVLTRQLCDAHCRVVAGPVTPTLDIGKFKRELVEFDFDEPRSLDDVLAWVISTMERGVVHITNPRYFGLYNPAPAFPAQCADRIAAVFNPQLATSTTSPVPVELEAHVVRAVAQRAGFPETSTGHFTTGGAEANYTALICALTRACPGFAMDGARAFGGRPTFYVSNEAHLAWLKIAHQSGIGRSAVRLVATDGCGRLAIDALAAAIAADRAAGNVPVMIVATAGTTNAGMIDPLAACGALARGSDLWYHVDAAWGGAAIASDQLRVHLEGVESADSVTVDAHKWFATTMGCGMFLTRDAPLLSSVFQVSTTYMPSNVRHLDPYVTSVQWSRRFLGLRLFLSLAVAGWDGYAGHVEQSVEMARRLRNELLSRDWTIVNESPLAVLCIRPPPGSPDERLIVSRVLESGRAWISIAVFEGREVIRACITHGETTQHDIDELVDALQAARGVGA